MRLLDDILGKPLKSNQDVEQKLGVPTGVALLGLDALSSTAYGPEAALTTLAALGAVGPHYLPAITLVILSLLVMLCFSYFQTIAGYSNGGGAYTVAMDNPGNNLGLVAAAALLVHDLPFQITVQQVSGLLSSQASPGR